MKDWYIETKDCTNEQQAIVERVYGAGNHYLNSVLDCKWVSNSSEGEKITPDEAFAILGLDKLLEPALDIDWDKLADGTATALVQYYDSLMPVKDGFMFVNNAWARDPLPEENRIITTRPKPKYNAEQLEAVKALAEWVKDNQFDNGKLLDMWLKEQELCVK